MQELLGRMTALDPEASESLKVISYFDALVEGHASIEAILRGAAILSGCGTSFVTPHQAFAVDRDGTRMIAPTVFAAQGWPGKPVSPDGVVWMEREAPAHVNDEMILERVSLALGITIARSMPADHSRKAVDTLIGPTSALDERREACAQLQLRLDERFLIIAEPATAQATIHHRTIVTTPVGIIRATLVRASDEVTPTGRAGFGTATHPDQLDQSWKTALIALRLTSPEAPVLFADDLGGLILLAGVSSDPEDAHPDLVALMRVIKESPRTFEVLEAITSTDSLRAAAAKLGLHHSTVQARAADLSSAFGYELVTPAGRTRLSIALSLYRLATTHF